MIARLLLSLPIVALLTGSVRAQGAMPETADNRYQAYPVEDGFVRLDLRNGQLSLCSRRPVGWACEAVPDDRAALDGEIARLQGENAALKKALLDRGLPLPGGLKPDQAAPKIGRDLKLPSQADIDRAISALERMWRRLLDMIGGLQKDMKKT
jgi:hypothetical protein